MTTKRFVAKFGLDNNNQTITNVANPVNSTDVATKSITDSVQSFAQSGFNAANTAASNTVYLQNVSNFSNTRILGVENSVVYLQGVTNQINVSAAFANTWLQSNDALTLSVSKTYTDNSNTQLKAYSDATFYTKTGGSISGPVTINSNLLVTGNLTVSGNVTSVSANNLVLKDNMIYLNEGATGNANPDIGITGAYDDGTYHHAGFFRDHATGTWKVFDNYLPEPDASPWIDQSNSSFRIANFQANTVTFGSILSTSNVLIQGPLVISANTSMTVPVGNTAQRPTGTNGMLRYNADTGSFEGYTVSGWGSIGGAIYMANTPPNNPQNGSTWWNTDHGKLLIYYTDADSSQWVDASPDQAGLLARPVRQTFIATSGQTSFTVTGGYTPGLVDVFLNGTKLVNGTDVTVSTGTNVVLATGAIVGSTLEVVGLNAASLTNVLPITGGTLTGDLQVPNLTYTGTLTGSANVINIGSGQIYKDTSGNVGIGTSSPSRKLHVYGVAAAGNIGIRSENNDSTGATLFEPVVGGISGSFGLNGTGLTGAVGGAGNIVIANYYASGGISFLSGGNTERMRLDSSGNVSIGTTSVLGKFSIQTAAGSSFNVRDSSPVTGSTGVMLDIWNTPSASSTVPFSIRSSQFLFGTDSGGTFIERMRIDASGNLGLGVAPSAWISNARSMELQGGSLWSTASSNISVGHNFYLDSSSVYRYKNTAAASYYFQSGGTHYWATAASGTSGNAITWTNTMTLESSGNLTIGPTGSPAVGMLTVRSNSTTGGTRLLEIINYAGSEIVAIFQNGLIYFPTTYSNTTASAANMYIASDGSILRSTSSIRYKNSITDAVHGLAEVLKLRPVTYKGNNDGDKVFGGLIAEEVHDAGLTEFVQYNDEGDPDALAYGPMVSLAFKAIQELSSKVDSLQSELNKLKGVN